MLRQCQTSGVICQVSGVFKEKNKKKRKEEEEEEKNLYMYI